MSYIQSRTPLLPQNFFFGLFAAGLFLALPVLTFAAPGDLDPTFGNGGRVITDFNRVEEVFAVVLQPDGKLIVAGATNAPAPPDFLIVRYNSDGSLDTSFGNGGRVTTDFGAADFAYAVALQPDGKIVAAGFSQSPSIGNIVFARYNANGSLDSTFGRGGRVITDINGQHGLARALVLQADGKIVAAGYTCVLGVRCSFTLFRYNSNGSLDSTFGSGGIVITNFGGQSDSARALVVQADGKIVAAGDAFLTTKSDFALARYNSNGTLDTTFGTGGKVTTDFGDSEDASDVVIQPDGKIVAAGSYGDGDPDNYFYKFSLARYNPDGTLDTTFGNGGKVLTDFGPSSFFSGLCGLALQADGKIVAAGGVISFDNNSAFVGENFFLVRYNTNGTLDTAFGTNGKVITNFGVNVIASGGIVIQPDGKIIAAGYAIHRNSSSDIALARYLGGEPSLAVVSAASFSGTELAADSIVAAFGTELATATMASSSKPLPTSLAGTIVTVRDSAGLERVAPLFFVSPSQVNYLMPPGTATGTVIVTITNGSGRVSVGTSRIATVAPALFAANANGQGVAVALALRVKADGSQSYEAIAQFDVAQNRFVARPLDLGPEGEQVYLILFGTGLRGRSSLASVIGSIGGTSAEVGYAGAQGDFVGLDQVNVHVPRSLAGRGEIDVLLTVEAQMSNAVRINIK